MPIPGKSVGSPGPEEQEATPVSAVKPSMLPSTLVLHLAGVLIIFSVLSPHFFLCLKILLFVLAEE